MKQKEINQILTILSKKYNFLFIFNDTWVMNSIFNTLNLKNFENLTWSFIIQTILDKRYPYIILFDTNNYLMNRIVFQEHNLKNSYPLMILNNNDPKFKIDFKIENNLKSGVIKFFKEKKAYYVKY